MSAAGETDLLASIPFGRLLARMLRLLVSADRREEFAGDLVEQAKDELAGSTPWQIGLWLWGQTLRSVPSLLAMRVRRFARRAASAAHLEGGGGRLTPVVPGLLLGAPAEPRSWPVPMVVSVSAHAVGLALLSLFTLGQIEELQAPWQPVVLTRALGLVGAPAVVEPPEEWEAPAPAPAPKLPRKPRLAPRAPAPGPTVSPAPSEPPATLDEDLGWLDEIAARAPISPPVEPEPVFLPPQVADKRCLSCPPPRLPWVFVRLGSEQRVDVRTCVGTRGDVTSVDVVRGLGALADAGVVDTVRAWRFAPHSVGDHPVPFCYPTRFVFTMN